MRSNICELQDVHRLQEQILHVALGTVVCLMPFHLYANKRLNLTAVFEALMNSASLCFKTH